MKNFTVLSSNNIGNIIKCKNCKELIIGMGTCILKFEPSQAEIFRNALADSLLECTDDAKKIFLKTPLTNLMIALNKKELLLGIELIDMALLQLEVNNILKVEC